MKEKKEVKKAQNNLNIEKEVIGKNILLNTEFKRIGGIKHEDNT
jgi:hypothetical protein